MGKKGKMPDMNLPIWFDGQNINEALFCEEFLHERRIIFANGAFFTPDGRVTDDLPLRGEIYEKLKFCAVNNIPRKITNILEVLKLEAQVPDFPPEQDRIHVSNGIGLKWSAFDFNHNCFSIRHTVTTCNVKGERVTIKKDKAKNKSSLRTYPLIPFLKERLLEAKKQQEENRKLCGRSYNKEYLGYVCVDVIGNLIKPNYVSSTFGKLLAKNNLRHIRFHDLRHTCASLLLANGVPMEQVKEWLGHSEISTTVDIYGHLQYATKKQSAAAIEQDIVAPMLQNLSAVSP